MTAGKVRLGNYVFLSWTGDHGPRHVHVYKEGALVVKWNLDDGVPMKGHANARLRSLIERLDKKGKL